MSAEDFRIVVSVGIMCIILTIKAAKAEVVRAIRELKEEIGNG